MMPRRLEPDERRIVEDEIRSVREAFPNAPRTFPFVAYLGMLVKRFRRKGIHVGRENVADMLLEWARSRNDVRLLVYVPLVARSPDIPEGLGHACRVVARHPDFVGWLDERITHSEGDPEPQVP